MNKPGSKHSHRCAACGSLLPCYRNACAKNYKVPQCKFCKPANKPEKDFAFAGEILTLRGEVATVGEPFSVKAKDTTGDLFAV